MELTDAERECRNDAADAEQEDQRIHVFEVGDTLNWCRVEHQRNGEYGPSILITMHDYGYEIGEDEVRDLDMIIDALTTAREHVFGPREEEWSAPTPWHGQA